jgi:hypothetical protein
MQIICIGEVVVVTQEWLDGCECGLGQSSSCEFDDIVEQMGNGFFVLRLHDVLHGGRQSSASAEAHYAPVAQKRIVHAHIDDACARL